MSETTLEGGLSFAACRYLSWDSDFFGRRIARINDRRLKPSSLGEVYSWCAEQRIECLYFFADPSDPTTALLAGAHGFCLTDVRVTLQASCKKEPVSEKVAKGIVIRPATLEDKPYLRAIARGSYTLSRFYFDSNFSKEECEALYDAWITNSCEGWADAVLVADLDGPAGYVTCHLGEEGQPGKIGLVGVRKRERGRGLAQALVESSMDWFRDHGRSKVDVATQARNVAAQRLYQRCGFFTRSVELCYHKWFQRSAS